MKKTLILISIFMIMLVSCSGKKHIKVANDIYDAGGAPMTYKMVSMAEGLEIAKNNPDAIIVDVRRDDEYKAGHIPGAVLLTMRYEFFKGRK